VINKTEGISITIVGAGPAGMMLAWLLVKNGVKVKVIERHLDFSREFRGEGIQESVMRHLEDLGLLSSIMTKKMGVKAEAARVFFNEIPVAVLKGIKADSDFGIILHQEKFLKFLHDELLKNDLYESFMGHNAISFEENDHEITQVITRDKNKSEYKIGGDIVVITAGRSTVLRKRLNLKAKKIDTHWNILWVLLPKPKNQELIPNGFKAYLNGDTLFIMYTNAYGMIQLAWSKKDETDLKTKDFTLKKAALLDEIPKPYKSLVKIGFTEFSKTQFLKVECDRLDKWHYKNTLFIGDAAHTMSPVGGQGINLAIRDSIVAANHIIDASQHGGLNPEELFPLIQKERMREIKLMQTFQQKFGFFMLGAPKLLSKAFFFVLLPILGAIGIKKRMLKKVQGGVTFVKFKHKR
jgi:2-polyprenyl-6-methoxyphenol hydroxylase-like FAD-dependent oxidoreductase